jgi:hypothetical protein
MTQIAGDYCDQQPPTETAVVRVEYSEKPVLFEYEPAAAAYLLQHKP